ncbi:hypothetical protein [Streptomyces sp. NPDC052225]|uniref:hypothetical protein n=1 Tax=Streptomyces sp. NPDC052225 TaxID=3154949 RepID=UPI003444D881
MPLSINEEADRRLGVAVISTEPPTPSDTVPGDAPHLLNCPSCGSSHVAQMLGDNGGISYVCTACGHSWS